MRSGVGVSLPRPPTFSHAASGLGPHLPPCARSGQTGKCPQSPQGKKVGHHQYRGLWSFPWSAGPNIIRGPVSSFLYSCSPKHFCCFFQYCFRLPPYQRKDQNSMTLMLSLHQQTFTCISPLEAVVRGAVVQVRG